MAEFRFQGLNARGKRVRSEFEASGKREAREKVHMLMQKYDLTMTSLDKKAVYHYRARRYGGSAVNGEQEAFSKHDLEQALQRLGYRVERIGLKWIDLKGGVPRAEVVTFIRLSADLLRQQLPFDQILSLLVEDTANRRMREVIREIQKDLRDGKEGQEVYSKHVAIFGPFASYMLGVASTSGNMAEVFESAARFLERDAAFRKNMRRALFMPLITVLAVIGVVLFYVAYIFPQTATMFLEFDITLPPMTAATLQFSNWLQANVILLAMMHVVPVAGLFAFLRTRVGKLWLDSTVIKLPVMGDLLHKTSIEIFARVFHTLYNGSGQNVEVIRVAAEACRNRYIEQQIKHVALPMMLNQGQGLVESLEATAVFPQTALSRFRLGAESGALKENAAQLAEYYQTQTTYKMDSAIDTISLAINLFIMVALVGITVVSSETAIIQVNY